MAERDGLVRVWVSIKGKRTTVSMDDVLFGALADRLGGNDHAIRWIRAAIPRIEQLNEVGSPLTDVAKAGTSRLVQRLALDHLLKPSDQV